MLFTPLPLSQTVTPSRTPSPLERDVLYGRPLTHIKLKNKSLRNVGYVGPSVYTVYKTYRV